MTRWVREAAGWLLAACLAVIATAGVAASPRSELLFRDGDSLVVALLARSLLEGGPQDWAMSSVLFLPETAVHVLLAAVLPLGVEGLLAVDAVVNLLGLYGALRVAAGRRRPGSAPVAYAVAGLLVFCLVAMTETSPSRDALELASLQLTTTYYSATVVAVVLTAGLLRRALDDRSRAALWILPAVAALSTLSNPLFAVWAAVPLAALLAVAALRAAVSRRPLALLGVLLGLLLGGTALGLLLRIPFSAWIANTGAGYVQPERWMQSLEYYGELLAERLATPLGVLGSLATLALIVVAAWLSAVSWRRRSPGSLLVLVAAWAVPLVVLAGAIAAGTHAARYLQPLVFMPVLALVAASARTRPSKPRLERLPGRLLPGRLLPVATLLAIAGLGAAASVPRLHASVTASDPDLACVTEWVDASGRTGAGQFWTVRLPKLHLDDPARLVQVDHRLHGYAWLVNRADFAVGAVSFLVQDAQTVPWDVPTAPDAMIPCGRYTILDFAQHPLRLGPQRS